MLNEPGIRIKSNLKMFRGRPDFVPFVNVLFLLLIFFMLSSSFIQVSGIKVELPEISTQTPLGVEKFVVTINRQGKIYFNDEEISKWDVLKERLIQVSSRSKSGTIVLRADSKATFDAVSKLMALAEEAKLNVFVATVSPAKDNTGVTFTDKGSDEQ